MNNKSVSVSIIVPIYKVEQYLRECIDSILDQTFTDFEVILVDDGSPDNCPHICEEYAKIDSRIKVIHKENGGLSSARNAGLDYVFKNSNCKYISFIDGDDFVANDFLEKLVCAIDGCDMSVCYYFRYAKDKCTKIVGGKHCVDSEQYWYLSLPEASGIVMWNKLYKKDLFSNIRFKEGTIIEDEFIRHYLICQCKKINIIDKALYYYRWNPTSIMHTQSEFVRQQLFLKVLLDRIDYSRKIENGPLLNVSINNFLLTTAMMDSSKRKQVRSEIATFKRYLKTYRNSISIGTHFRYFIWAIHPKFYKLNVKIYNSFLRRRRTS